MPTQPQSVYQNRLLGSLGSFLRQAGVSPTRSMGVMTAAWSRKLPPAAYIAPAAKGYRSELGSASTRERRVLLGVTDYAAIPAVYWEDAKVREALHKALQRAITAGMRSIPGCSIGVKEGVTVRT